MDQIRISKTVHRVSWSKSDTEEKKMEKLTTAIKTVKEDIRLKEWSEQVAAQQASGISVQKWCDENGINLKTYYYRLRKVRENCIESAPAIVPMPIQHQSSEIRIEKNDLQITLPTDTSSEILIDLIRELC